MTMTMSSVTTPMFVKTLNPKNPTTITPSITKPSSPSSPFLSFSLRQNIKHLVCNTVPRCSLDYSHRDSYEEMGVYPRPPEVKWSKEICNSVQLIGYVGVPVQITRLNAGKVVASTSLAVRKTSTETSWISLTFWDELAYTAYQHVEKGQQIYVSGRVVSDTVDGEDGKKRTYYKVVVQQLNFVERDFPSPVGLYDGNGSFNATASAEKFDKLSATDKLSTQELWQAFFANPVDWWDNRKDKRNPKYPDFKHKDTGEALWVESRYNPPWVKSQLEILDSRVQPVQHQDDSGLFKYLKDGF